MSTGKMTATWTGGMRFVHKSSTGHAVVTDAGEEGTAATPMELMILGLLGCTGIDVTSILERMRQPLEGMELSATFERAENHPKVYTKIHLTYALKGALDEEKVRRAIDLSETNYCSVTAMLGKSVEITSDFVIES